MQNECLFALLRKRSQDEVRLEATANFAFIAITLKRKRKKTLCV